MLSPYAWIAAGLLALSLFGGTYWKGYTVGRDHVQMQWNADKAAQIVERNKAIADRIAENSAIATKHNAEMIGLKKGYENEIAKTRADSAASPRLRVSTSAVCGQPAVAGQGSSPGPGDADPAASRLLPAAIDANLRSLMTQADEMAAGYRVCQAFIVEQGMAP